VENILQKATIAT